MSNQVNDIWFDRASSLLPFVTAGEAESLNHYKKVDLETFVLLVRRLETKYLSESDVEAADEALDEDLDVVLAERVKRATEALNRGVY